MQVARHVVLGAEWFEWNNFMPLNETNVGDNRRIHSAYTREVRRTSVKRNWWSSPSEREPADPFRFKLTPKRG